MASQKPRTRTTTTETIEELQDQAEADAREAAVMSGGPGDEGSDETFQPVDDLGNPADDLLSIDIGGTEYQVNKDAAEAYQVERTASDSAIQDLRGQMARAATAPEPVAPVIPETPDYSTTLFEDPNAVIAQLKEEIRSDVVNEVTSAYNADQGQKNFWDEFYETNADLQSTDILVKGVMQANWNTLAPLPTSQAGTKLAELARREILKITKAAKTPSRGDRSTTIEGASTPAAADAPANTGDQPVSLTDILKSRKAKRRAAAS